MALLSKSVLNRGDFGFTRSSKGRYSSTWFESFCTLSASNIRCLLMIFEHLQLLLLLHGLQMVLLSICDFFDLFQNVCLILNLNAVLSIEALWLALKVHEIFRTWTSTEVREDVTGGSTVLASVLVNACILVDSTSLSASCLCICSWGRNSRKRSRINSFSTIFVTFELLFNEIQDVKIFNFILAISVLSRSCCLILLSSILMMVSATLDHVL